MDPQVADSLKWCGLAVLGGFLACATLDLVVLLVKKLRRRK